MIMVLLNPITIMLATLAIQWVSLGEIGPYTLQLPYLTFLLVALFAVSGPRKLAGVGEYLRSNASWLFPWTFYLVIITAVLSGSEGATIAPRQIFYLVAGVALGGCLAATPRLRPILRTGAALGFITFIVAIEIFARRIGLSWIDAIDHFITDGNLNFVIYSFFRAIFNYVATASGDAISAARKNDIAACILVLGLVFRSASTKPQRDFVGMAVMGLALALLLLLNTRSVLIVGGMGVLLATLVAAASQPRRNSGAIALKLLGIGIALLLALQFSINESAASATLGDRFSFDDYSSEARINQLEFAITTIGQHPFTGIGYTEVDGQRIHNLFLGAWIHAGVIPFLLVVIFYVVIVSRWAAITLRYARNPQAWVLPLAFEWLAPLPLLPFFRVWLSGDAGHPFISEWIAIAIFFGCELANRLSVSRQRSSFRGAEFQAHSRKLPVGRSSLGSVRRSNGWT